MSKPLSNLIRRQVPTPFVPDSMRVVSVTPAAVAGLAGKGGSAASMMAACVGQGVKHLEPNWPRLLLRLGRLGAAVFVTRHGGNSHEKLLHAGKLQVSGNLATLNDQDGSLEVDTSHWHCGFARYEGKDPQSRCISLHFFDIHGQLLHSIYPTLSCHELGTGFFHGLFSAGQTPEVFLPPLTVSHKRKPKDADSTSLLVHWRYLKHCQAIPVILQKHRLTRWQALQLLPREYAVHVQPEACLRLLQQASAQEVEVRLTLFNPGITQTHTGLLINNGQGQFSNRTHDAWFRLGFDDGGLNGAWVVHKPTVEGILSSLEVFDPTGELMLVISGSPRSLVWQRLLHSTSTSFAI